MGLAQDLVNKGHVPLTRDNLALYIRALGYDVGPVGSTVPGPVAEHLFAGYPHYSIAQFEARGGSIRQLDLPKPLLGAPIPVAEVRKRTAEAAARREMFESAEHPSSIAAHIQYLLNDMPNPDTPAGQAARARVENSLRVLEDLAQRYRGRVSAWDM
jgi:hypothetical protein